MKVARTPDVKNTKRVLDITQGSLCYVVGTIYMEMRLKPNILEELAREVCPRKQHGYLGSVLTPLCPVTAIHSSTAASPQIPVGRR